MDRVCQPSSRLWESTQWRIGSWSSRVCEQGVPCLGRDASKEAEYLDAIQANKTVLIIVENLPVPMDRRVWQQATALVRAGYRVHVICPKSGKYTKSNEVLQGVFIHRHSLPIEGSGIARYIIEYLWALVAEAILTIKVMWKVRIDVIQACNPPDNIFLIGTFARLFTGSKFIFDHHDPFAELFSQKFSSRPRLRAIVDWFERRSLRSADRVITTSEELRQLAIVRHGVEPGKVTLVRSGFDLNRIPVAEPDTALKNGKKFLVLYVGVMGAQDGLDLLLEAAAYLVHELKQDVQFVLVGGGSELLPMRTLASKLNLNQCVQFTGYLEGSSLIKLFKTADLGVCPDPKNSFNDKLSMNKILEYMAFGLPIVQFDLTEGKRLAGDAAAYASNNDPRQLAIAMADLLNDSEERARKGELGMARVRDMFAWQKQEAAYISVYNELLAEPSSKLSPIDKATIPAGRIFGFTPTTLTAKQIVARLCEPLKPGDGVQLVVTPNIDHIARLRHDVAFRRAYNNAAIVACDGFPVVAFAHLRGLAVAKVTGCDLLTGLLQQRDATFPERYFFIVDSEHTAAAVKAWARDTGFDNSIEVTAAPRPFLHDSDWRASVVRRIQAFCPKFLIMAVGAPQSEIFVDAIRHELPPCWALCVGQAIKVELGLVRRAPSLVQNLGMEWAWRSVQEPRRLIPRYFRASAAFLRSAVAEFLDSSSKSDDRLSDGSVKGEG